MAMKIRLARGGSKKRPFYRIVAADSRMPRDGRFIEKLGSYNPLLPKDSEDRVKMDVERIQYWLGQGAQPTDRIARMLEAAGVKRKGRAQQPQEGHPRQEGQERAEGEGRQGRGRRRRSRRVNRPCAAQPHDPHDLSRRHLRCRALDRHQAGMGEHGRIMP